MVGHTLATALLLLFTSGIQMVTGHLNINPDYYKFTIPYERIVNINLSGMKADADLYLLSADGSQLNSSAAVGNLAENINTSLPAGEYYLKVQPKALQPEDDYKLKVDQGLTPNVVWRDTSSGSNTLWSINGTSFGSSTSLNSLSGSAWKMGALADFDKDGYSDILFYNDSTGQKTVWFMKDSTYLRAADLTTNGFDSGWTAANWVASAAGDMNLDGNPDILWRNSSTGENQIWLMKGLEAKKVALLPAISGSASEWKLSGVGDYDNDGDLDIYWKRLNASNGQTVVWEMDREVYAQTAASLNNVNSVDWWVRGIADFNSDGYADLLFRRLASTWEAILWLMDGGTAPTSSPTIGTVSGSGWQPMTPYLKANDPIAIDAFGDTTAIAYDLGNGTSTSGVGDYFSSIGSSADRSDYFKIITTGPANITATLYNDQQTGGDQSTVDIRNSSDTVITGITANVNNGSFANISTFQSSAGTFYVKVSQSVGQDANSTADKYKITINVNSQFASSGLPTNFVNIDIGSKGLEPMSLVPFKGQHYFLDSTTENAGLWTTDGTAEGTFQVFSITPASEDLIPTSDRLFFSAYDSDYGIELYESDGTSEGTVLVKDINSSGDSNPSEMIAMGSILYFNATDGTNGRELWKSDGTAAGTMMVKNINTTTNSDGTPGGSNPLDLTIFKGKIYFAAFTGANGYEPWVSDGTSTGTVLLKEISYRAADNIPDSFPYNFIEMNGVLYFVATQYVNPSGTDTGVGVSLWKTDGTSGGTVLVKDINTTAHYGDAGDTPIYEITKIGNTLFLSATNGTDGYQLWSSNGTSGGTAVVRTVNSPTGADPVDLTPVGTTLYYAAKDSTGGVELWKSDGTSGGTVQVKDIYSGSTGSYPHSLTNINGTLYFSAIDSSSGREAWKSDGTSGGTVQVKDIYVGTNSSEPGGFTRLSRKDDLIFFASSEHDGLELYRSCGCSSGTVQIADLGKSFGPINAEFVSNGTISVFGMNSLGNGVEPWKTDGTSGGTVLIKDIVSGSQSSDPHDFVVMGGSFYFIAEDSNEVSRLYKTDGTSAGTGIVHTSGTEVNVQNPVVSGTTLYYFGQTTSGSVTTTSLYKTDGTNAGTSKVKDLNTTGEPVSEVILMGSTLYFSASDGTNGYELWKSDGTSGGTVLVKDINTSGNSLPRFLTPISSTLFFTADDGTNGGELWKSDGTSGGTVLVKNIETTAGLGSEPQKLTAIGSTLYFSATTSANGTELWKSDGTSSGTVLVKDINTGSSGADGSTPQELTPVGSTLYFSATTSTNGTELWKSDGTSGGTVLVKDIYVGSDDSAPSELVNFSGTLYFLAMTPDHGYELWKSDGTSSGTVEIKDFNPGLDYGVSGLKVVGSNLYFVTGQPTTVGFWKI
ncbi:FG-GAP-like repeat-containing protein (plasmid) [Kovacikia minuta CCNUW1]|uniref:ELWxxDGT repeat protein n=1 Tax=Kovacikia minuta TaxID=2931930 RepID=UPI001CCED02F|nr:ELWxxDGT repeat protein [Kovacikia minuta]UBF29908.1 FG-GAP-like repeat-containing protein [Kovacikia minuta CCNUW1]